MRTFLKFWSVGKNSEAFFKVHNIYNMPIASNRIMQLRKSKFLGEMLYLS